MADTRLTFFLWPLHPFFYFLDVLRKKVFQTFPLVDTQMEFLQNGSNGDQTALNLAQALGGTPAGAIARAALKNAQAHPDGFMANTLKKLVGKQALGKTVAAPQVVKKGACALSGTCPVNQKNRNQTLNKPISVAGHNQTGGYQNASGQYRAPVRTIQNGLGQYNAPARTLQKVLGQHNAPVQTGGYHHNNGYRAPVKFQAPVQTRCPLEDAPNQYQAAPPQPGCPLQRAPKQGGCGSQQPAGAQWSAQPGYGVAGAGGCGAQQPVGAKWSPQPGYGVAGAGGCGMLRSAVASQHNELGSRCGSGVQAAWNARQLAFNGQRPICGAWQSASTENYNNPNEPHPAPYNGSSCPEAVELIPKQFNYQAPALVPSCGAAGGYAVQMQTQKFNPQSYAALY